MICGICVHDSPLSGCFCLCYTVITHFLQHLRKGQGFRNITSCTARRARIRNITTTRRAVRRRTRIAYRRGFSRRWSGTTINKLLVGLDSSTRCGGSRYRGGGGITPIDRGCFIYRGSVCLTNGTRSVCRFRDFITSWRTYAVSCPFYAFARLHIFCTTYLYRCIIHATHLTFK